jgi:hypothetical protein
MCVIQKLQLGLLTPFSDTPQFTMWTVDTIVHSCFACGIGLSRIILNLRKVYLISGRNIGNFLKKYIFRIDKKRNIFIISFLRVIVIKINSITENYTEQKRKEKYQLHVDE